MSFLLGCCILLIWPVWVIVSAPRAFFLNLFRIPALNGEWLVRIHKSMSFSRVELTVESLTNVGCLAILATGLYLFVSIALCRGRTKLADMRGFLFSFIITAGMFGIAYIPPIMWKQYLAMPVPFMIICLMYMLMWLRGAGCFKFYKAGLIIFIVAIIVTVGSHTIVLRRIPKIFNLNSWVPVRIHRISEDIAARTKGRKLALTMGGLYAIEGGLDSYKEFSAGPFVYRVADFLSQEEREIVTA
ncbi:MAG: hypothetical protein ABII09_10250 [Planctomycetota bacterium]